MERLGGHCNISVGGTGRNCKRDQVGAARKVEESRHGLGGNVLAIRGRKYVRMRAWSMARSAKRCGKMKLSCAVSSNKVKLLVMLEKAFMVVR